MRLMRQTLPLDPAALKLAYLINTYPRASHSFIRREVQALERLGWEVHRFAMRSALAELVDPADIAEDARTEHVLKSGAWGVAKVATGWMVRRPARAFSALRLAWRCGVAANDRFRHLIYLAEGAVIAQRCYDLRIPHLHAHFGTNSTTVAMLAQTLGGPSFSFTTHGPEEFDAPAALSLPEKLNRAAFAIAISSYGRSQLCRWAALPDWPRIHVVHCGIEPWRFPDPAPLPSGGPHLVAIGRLAEQKGFPLLVEAIALARETTPQVHLTLVGDGPLRAELESLTLNLQNHITFAGWQDESGVRAALAASTALILPSFAEGLPVVIMEAMAAGRPIIATSIAGVPELVTPDTGWLVPAGDATALATAIQTLAQTPADTLTQLGAAARARALSRHDINTEAEKLTTLFASRGRA
jgi:colanic acid/amylovoran biosynthesis glycosyltransferase